MLDSKAATPQPMPQTGKVAVAPVVIADIEARVEAGRQKYGTLLETHNGRSALWDLYQELIDACMYARQRILEEEKVIKSAPPQRSGRNHRLSINEAIDVIGKEVLWHEQHQDRRLAKPYRTGFINGLIHARQVLASVNDAVTDRQGKTSRRKVQQKADDDSVQTC